MMNVSVIATAAKMAQQMAEQEAARAAKLKAAADGWGPLKTVPPDQVPPQPNAGPETLPMQPAAPASPDAGRTQAQILADQLSTNLQDRGAQLADAQKRLASLNSEAGEMDSQPMPTLPEPARPMTDTERGMAGLGTLLAMLGGARPQHALAGYEQFSGARQAQATEKDQRAKFQVQNELAQRKARRDVQEFRIKEAGDLVRERGQEVNTLITQTRLAQADARKDTIEQARLQIAQLKADPITMMNRLMEGGAVSTVAEAKEIVFSKNFRDLAATANIRDIISDRRLNTGMKKVMLDHRIKTDNERTKIMADALSTRLEIAKQQLAAAGMRFEGSQQFRLLLRDLDAQADFDGQLNEIDGEIAELSGTLQGLKGEDRELAKAALEGKRKRREEVLKQRNALRAGDSEGLGRLGSSTRDGGVFGELTDPDPGSVSSVALAPFDVRRVITKGIQSAGFKPDTACKRGVDCSSFVQNAFANMGVTVPRTTYEQKKIGVPVSMDQLQAGDMVFFDTLGQRDPQKDGVGHVGIFVGNDANGRPVFAHASGGASKGYRYKLDSLTDPYYSKRFRFARRVIPGNGNA